MRQTDNYGTLATLDIACPLVSTCPSAWSILDGQFWPRDPRKIRRIETMGVRNMHEILCDLACYVAAASGMAACLISVITYMLEDAA